VAASDVLKFQADTLTKLVEGVSADQMEDPTPCAEWDVRALINHFVGGATMFAAAFAGEAVEIDDNAPMPDMVGDDPVGSFSRAVGEFMQAVDQPGAMDREIPLPFGVLPAPVVLQLLKFDLTVHAWDLAQATGQTYEPADDVVAEADAIAHQMVSAELRASGAFGPEISPPADATPMQKLIAFTGRTP
jgi:uncharacterized protein (TIGR03086 family)